MKYTIKKGGHRGSPLFWDLILNKYPSIKYRCTFSDDVPYNLDGDPNTMSGDDWDCNKLVGFGFVNFKKFPPHHWDSIRVGWEWDSEKKVVSLFAYAYVEGERIIKELIPALLGIPFDIEIFASDSSYFVGVSMTINGQKQTRSISIDRKKKRGIAYLLGPYFGGNRIAPHDITLFLSES